MRKEFECILIGDNKVMNVKKGQAKVGKDVGIPRDFTLWMNYPQRSKGFFLLDNKHRVEDMGHGMCEFVSMFKE